MPLDVTRTYLDLSGRDQFRASLVDDPRVDVSAVRACPPSFFRYLYGEVGRAYHWVDRLGWSDERIREYLSGPAVSLWLMRFDGAPAGYFELARGGHLLSRAVAQAWEDGARRVWLHTCTLDDPAAMPNYLKRGFKPFKTETYQITSPLPRAGEG